MLDSPPEMISACHARSWCNPGSSRRSQSSTWARGSPGSSGPGTALTRRPVPYDAPDYAGAGVALVLGSEGSGLRPRVAGACDELISLPLLGRIESLGVSAAASALLYEILQNRSRGA